MENLNERLISAIHIYVDEGKVITNVWMMNGNMYRLENFIFTQKDGDPIEGHHYLELNGITHNEFEMFTAYLVENLKHCRVDFHRHGEHLEGVHVAIIDSNDSSVSTEISADLNGDASTKAEFVEDIYWAILHATHMASYVNKPLYKIHAVSMKGYGVWPILAVCHKLFN